MPQMQTNPPIFKEVIKGIESTGEDLKRSFRELSKIAQKRIDSKINNAKFEAVYAITISKKQREKTMNEVKDIRNSLWKEALKKAKGDTNKASVIYEDLCAFD